MEGLEPVSIPGETRPEPEDKKQQNPIIRLLKIRLKFMIIGFVFWRVTAILIALWFPAHVERWDVVDYGIKTRKASLGTRVSLETFLSAILESVTEQDVTAYAD